MKGNGLSSAPLTGVLSLVIAVAAAWLAVATQSWEQTLLLAGVSLIYLVSPPSGNLPRPVLILFGLALLLGLTAFLPIGHWEGSIRQPFLDHGIALPSLLSAQPWWSLEDVLLLFASLLWAWSCFEAKFALRFSSARHGLRPAGSRLAAATRAVSQSQSDGRFARHGRNWLLRPCSVRYREPQGEGDGLDVHDRCLCRRHHPE
jgi:hypothetical protein